MATLSSSAYPFPPSLNLRRPRTAREVAAASLSINAEDSDSRTESVTTSEERWWKESSGSGGVRDSVREREAKDRKEATNNKIASQKAISIILRREATKAAIEKKKGLNSKKLLPRTVLESLHDRITALRWESALQVRSRTADLSKVKLSLIANFVCQFFQIIKTYLSLSFRFGSFCWKYRISLLRVMNGLTRIFSVDHDFLRSGI